MTSPQLKALLTETRAILNRAEKAGRDLTPDEKNRVDGLLTRARKQRDDDTRVTRRQGDTDMRKMIGEWGDDIGLGGRPGFGSTSHNTGKAGGRPASWWTEQARTSIEKATGSFGVKAIATGSITTGAPLADPDLDYSAMAQSPTRLVDLLMDRVTISDSNTFTYLTQTQRDHNAAPVADAAEKPTSIYRMEEREGRVRVIAHLSEATPERFFTDTIELERFLQSEMEHGLLTALETQIVQGDGTGENLLGILATSGTFSSPYTSNLPTTLRKARTALEVAGEIPTAWALHPAEAETIDLLREGADGAFLNGNFAANILGALPVVPTVAVPPGVALLCDWNLLQLVVREEARLDADRSGDLFRTNMVQMRVEGRYGFAVRRTTAICKVTLAAG